MITTIVDSTGVQLELEALPELPPSVKHPRKKTDHPFQRCYRISHAGSLVGFTWSFTTSRRCNAPTWRGLVERTGRTLGDFQNREAAIGAVTIEALRRDERFAKLAIPDRERLLLPSPKRQRADALHRLIADLGGGAEARRVAETMQANREAVDRWCLAMIRVDERVAADHRARGNLRKKSRSE